MFCKEDYKSNLFDEECSSNLSRQKDVLDIFSLAFRKPMSPLIPHLLDLF